MLGFSHLFLYLYGQVRKQNNTFNCNGALFLEKSMWFLCKKRAVVKEKVCAKC